MKKKKQLLSVGVTPRKETLPHNVKIANEAIQILRGRFSVSHYQ